MSVGLVGLTFVYAFDVIKYMEYGINMVSELEIKMNVVECIVEYLDKLLESFYDIDVSVVFGIFVDWSKKGKFEVDNFSMRYRFGLFLVLKNLIFIVNLGEKVGICGCIGSGKFFMFVVLFWIVELVMGTVRLDGIDIRAFGL